MRTISLVVVVVLTTLTISASAFAQGETGAPPAVTPMTAAPGSFGRQGQIAISADLPFTSNAPQFAIVHQSQSMGGGSSTIFALAPSADYFVAPNLSVGGLLAFGKGTADDSSGGGSDVTVIGLEVRGGYNIALTDVLSLWPRLAIGYSHSSYDLVGGSVSQNSTFLSIRAPVLWHPAPHFFVGAGPMFAADLSSSASSMGTSADQPKATQFGIDAVIGGYFGGT